MSNLETPCPTATGPARSAGRRLATWAALSLSLVAGAVFAAPASAVEPEIPPVVEANPAVPGAGSYTLEGTIYTYSLDTHYHFEYGTTTAYGTSIPVPDADAGTAPVVQVSQVISGLMPNTTYHFRISASNSKGPGMSGDQSFTTSTDPSAPPPSIPPPNQNEGGHPGKKIMLKKVKIKGRSVLATSSGRTLYSLSAEKNGKFICTKASGCLALWHPLMVPKGSTVAGPVKLGTIKRPEGGTQATFHGRPLYTFAPDTKAGEAKGEGLKDVGTWHAVTVPK
jgi:predicted lipoprotein with Yx(FWY)xxD motif